MRTCMAFIAALSVVAASGALGQASPPVSPCDMPAASTVGWRVVDEEIFELRVPPDFERIPVQNQDSHIVGHWGSARLRGVGYELSWYANPLRGAAQQYGYTGCTMQIGDRTAFVIASSRSAEARSNTAPRISVAASWDPAPDGPTARLRLTMSAISDRPNEHDVLIAIIRSVRFKHAARRD